MIRSLDFFPKSGYNKRACDASVAQSVVHLTRNEKVACSSQVTSSKNYPRNRDGFGGFCVFLELLRKWFLAVLANVYRLSTEFEIFGYACFAIMFLIVAGSFTEA